MTMAYYEQASVPHMEPYSPAEMRHLGALEAYGFLVRMRAHVTPDVPRVFAQVLAQADALVGVLVTLAAEGLPATPPRGERLGDDVEEDPC
jgi:hypothetical protein